MGGGVSTACAGMGGYTDYGCLPWAFSGADLDRERVLEMKRRVLAALTAAVLALAVQTAVRAAGMGSLKLQLAGGGRPIRNAEVVVYRAGTAVVGGYRLTEAFGGGFVSEADVLYPELAEWLARDAGEDGLRGRTDDRGEASFGPLEEGLYLVAQEGQAGGYGPFEPFVVILPWDGAEWDITAAPKMERADTDQPRTADPGTLDRGLWGVAWSALALCRLLRKRREYFC